MTYMYELEVSADSALLEIDLDKAFNDGQHSYLEEGQDDETQKRPFSIRIKNDHYNPASTIYCILKRPGDYDKLSMKGALEVTDMFGNLNPKVSADLIFFIDHDITMESVAFRNTDNVMITDYDYYRDDNDLIVLRDDVSNYCSITLLNCHTPNVYFLCSSLTWTGGGSIGRLYADFHGQQSEMILTELELGSLEVKKGEECLQNLAMTQTIIKGAFECHGTKTLQLEYVDLLDNENCLISAETINKFVNVTSRGGDVIVKTDNADISRFIAPRGKVHISASSWIEFTTDGCGDFKGLELNIDIASNAINSEVLFPHSGVYFDKITVTGASVFNIPGMIYSGIVKINDAQEVFLANSKVGHLTYKTTKGEIVFGKTSDIAEIDNLWLIGEVVATFKAKTTLLDLDTMGGKCGVLIKNAFEGGKIKLNLDLPVGYDYGADYFGINIENKNDAKIEIETILAKLNRFVLAGKAKIGSVIAQPISAGSNLIQIDARFLNEIIINEFFAGFDHDIQIDETTGSINLVRQTIGNLARLAGTITADVDTVMQRFMTIRAGQGLSFDGRIDIIDGNIDLFTEFGRLSVRGVLAGRQVQMIAQHGSIDLSATFNAYSVVTYAQQDSFVFDTIINAQQYLAHTLKGYMQIDSVINCPHMSIISDYGDVALMGNRFTGEIANIAAGGNIWSGGNSISAKQQTYKGRDVIFTDGTVSGEFVDIDARGDIDISSTKVDSLNVVNKAGRSIRIYDSEIRADFISNEAEKDILFAVSKISAKQRIRNKAGRDISAEDSGLMSTVIESHAGGRIDFSGSDVLTKLMINYAEGSIDLKDANIAACRIIVDSKDGVNVENSTILTEDNAFVKAIGHYLQTTSDFTLSQYPYQLFTKSSGDGSVASCGFKFDKSEILGLVGSNQWQDYESFGEFEYHLVNSSQVDLGVYQYLTKLNQKSVFIDAGYGVIMGGKIDGANHKVMVRTVHGLDLLPVSAYNSVMFGGGFKEEGLKHAITQIKAGVLNLDIGGTLKTVGALLEAEIGQVKAREWLNENANIDETEYKAKIDMLGVLAPWLTSPVIYEKTVNHHVVPTRLEFRELTDIDLTEGKIDLYFPYGSKKVHLRQRQGDVEIDRDVHFDNEMMAVDVDNGRIFMGARKSSDILRKFKLWGMEIGTSHTEHYTEHVSVSGNDIQMRAGGDIEMHGSIDAKDVLLESKDGDIRLESDVRHGNQLSRSVISADNAYVLANNVEIEGALVKVKDDLTIIANGKVKVLPVELVTRYHEASSSGKYTSDETRIQNIVSEINAGKINIDADRAVEFVSTLIETMELNIKAEELNISSAKDIFDKQARFIGGKDFWGNRRNQWSDHQYTETVIPSEIKAGQIKLKIDKDTTLEAAQIICQDAMVDIGGDFVLKDGYNVHVHDHHQKKYSVIRSDKGKLKTNNSRSISSITQGDDSVPTVICSSGMFYGVVGGKMHLLGSHIKGKDVHLEVPKGIKIEAAKHSYSHLVCKKESGFTAGFSKTKDDSKVTASAGVFKSLDKKTTYGTEITSASIQAEGRLNMVIQEGTLHQISSHLAGRMIQVEAQDWITETYSATEVSRHLEKKVEVGIKLTAEQKFTALNKKYKDLVRKKGNHLVDDADRALKAYDMFKSFAQLPTNGVKVGLYAYGEASRQEMKTSASIAIDNTISGEVIVARIANDMRFRGVKMSGVDIDIAAKNFTFEASSDQSSTFMNCGKVGIEVDLELGDKIADVNVSESQQKSSTESNKYHRNYIKASGNLRICLDGDGKFKGVSLEGTTVDIKANNLILESVQDKVERAINGMNMHVGLRSFGGGITKGSYSSAWTNQVARIVGSQVVNVAVKETLDITAGLIASAEEDASGNLTESGKLSLNCARLITKTLHDYDEGYSLSVGANFQVDNKESDDKISFGSAPLSVHYKSKKGISKTVIGQGDISCKSKEGDFERILGDRFRQTQNLEYGLDSVIHNVYSDLQEAKKFFEKGALQGSFDYAAGVVANALGSGRDLTLVGTKLVNFFGTDVDEVGLDVQLSEFFKIEIRDHTPEKLQKFIAKTVNEIGDKNIKASEDSDLQESLKILTQKAFLLELDEASKNNPNLKRFKDIYKRHVEKCQQEDGVVPELEDSFMTVLKQAQETGKFGARYKKALIKILGGTQVRMDTLREGYVATHKAYFASQELNKDAESFFDSVRGFNMHAPAAGDDDLEDSKDYPAGQLNKEDETKFQNYNMRVEQELAKHKDLPEDISESDQRLVDEIREQIESKVSNLENSDKEALVAQSFYLYKKCQNHPERTPEILLAGPPAYAAAYGLYEAGIALGAVISAAIAYKTSQDTEKTSRIILDDNDYKEFENLHERRKGGRMGPPSSNNDCWGHSSTYMPDPGDFEPDDDPDDGEEKSFDPSKDKNHDKIRRDERYGKLYRDKKDPNVWWSKDRGGDRGHGGPHWKRFKEVRGKLIRDADVDMQGNVMQKNPHGSKKVTINLKDTIGIK